MIGSANTDRLWSQCSINIGQCVALLVLAQNGSLWEQCAVAKV